jgi:hypothetical protein
VVAIVPRFLGPVKHPAVGNCDPAGTQLACENSYTCSIRFAEEVMSQKKSQTHGNCSLAEDGRSDNLRDSAMMAHLLEALEAGTDIGHYGRLTFVMVARHFLDEEEMVRLLANQPGQDETKARALVLQVRQKDYNPPKRERIREWQAQQEFPIIPQPEDPNCGNVYRELRFPDGIYDHISVFWEEKAESQEAGEAAS